MSCDHIRIKQTCTSLSVSLIKPLRSFEDGSSKCLLRFKIKCSYYHLDFSTDCNFSSCSSVISRNIHLTKMHLPGKSVRKLGIGEVIVTNRCHENLSPKLPLTDVMKPDQTKMVWNSSFDNGIQLYACDWLHVSSRVLIMGYSYMLVIGYT